MGKPFGRLTCIKDSGGRLGGTSSSDKRVRERGLKAGLTPGWRLPPKQESDSGRDNSDDHDGSWRSGTRPDQKGLLGGRKPILDQIGVDDLVRDKESSLGLGESGDTLGKPGSNMDPMADPRASHSGQDGLREKGFVGESFV